MLAVPDVDNCRFDKVTCEECSVAASDPAGAVVSAVVNTVVALEFALELALAEDWSKFVADVFLIDLEEEPGRGDSDDDSDAEVDDGASRSVRGILRGGCPPGCSRDENEAVLFVLGRLSFREEFVAWWF